MKLEVRRNWPLFGGLCLMLCVASFGFWGGWLVTIPTVPPGPSEGAELWLDDPIPPVRTDRVSVPVNGVFLGALTGGRSPFLTAWETGLFGPEVGHAPAFEADPEGDPWPELRAVIRRGDELAVILNSSVARLGERVEGVEVIEVDCHRVLVKSAEGSRWLDIAAGGRPWSVEGK